LSDRCECWFRGQPQGFTLRRVRRGTSTPCVRGSDACDWPPCEARKRDVFTLRIAKELTGFRRFSRVNRRRVLRRVMARLGTQALRPPRMSSSPEGLSRQLGRSMRVAVPGSNLGSGFAEYGTKRALHVSAVLTRATGCLVQRESGDVSRA